MPKGMNKLKDLQFLSDYIVWRHDQSGIKELGTLANLHGSLAIHNLENVLNGSEALEARMIDKEHIHDLEFNWSSHDNIVADFQTEKDIFDKLQPSTKLKELSIRGYRGEIFPDWFGQSSYHRMTKLTLSECSNCCKLPPLGQLPSLKKLEISGFDKLSSIGAEFYKNDEFCRETPFPSLETLQLSGLSSWHVWHASQFDDSFPQLKELSIRFCPMLRGDLPHHLPSLEELNVDGCEQLTYSLPSAPSMLGLSIIATYKVRLQELPLSLWSLSIEGGQLVEFAFEAMTHNQLTCLRSLYISDCSSAISFPGACMPASLQYLEIRDCENLEFPSQQQQESLQCLRIHGSCVSLTSFPLATFPNLTELQIAGCINMKCLEVPQLKDAAALPPSLCDLMIDSCPSFASLLSQYSQKDDALPSLHALDITRCSSFVFSTLGKVAPQLEQLSIVDCPEIDSFGEEGGDGSLPPTMRDLCISSCEKLVRWLASSTVLHSRSLRLLSIKGACDSVKSFPREGWLPPLSLC